MKVVKIILFVILAVIALAAIAGMFMSSRFAMERSVIIDADQKVIFDQVNTLRNWEQWSPWVKMDPEIKITYDGPASGVGASYSWVGTKTKEGTLTITESIPYESITTEMDFRKDGKGTAGFKIAKAEGGNKVSWWFESDMGSNPFKKLMMGMMGKSFMGNVFDQGLNDIKKIAEAMPPSVPEPPPVPGDTLAKDSIK
jgi:hypothetical protein